jgi:hypothetical protein
MEQRTILGALGGIRTGIGAALVVAPAFAGRIWVGEDAGGHGTRVFARALGARDVVLGGSLLAALRGNDERAAARLARSGVLADAADVVATVIAARNLQGSRRWMMPLIAGAVACGGALVWSVADDEPAAPVGAEEGIADHPEAVLAEMGATPAGVGR